MNIQTLEEEVNTFKEVQDFVVACRNIPHRLTIQYHTDVYQDTWKGTHPEENTNSSENGLCGRKWLK